MKKPYEVERDVPLPHSKSTFPLDSLEVGDSFFIPEGSKIGSLRTTISKRHAKKVDSKRFTVRTVDGGHRCWRLKDR